MYTVGMRSSDLPYESARGPRELETDTAINTAYRRFQDAVIRREPGFALCELEPTTRCVARCAFCPRHALARPAGELALDTARRMADNLAPAEPRAVLLSGFGEPTLHPDLPGIVRALRARLRTLIGVVTNGAELNPRLAGALLDAGLDFFHVSVVAATAVTARRIAPGLDFAATERNLEDLLARTAGRTPVAVNFVVTPDNRDQKADVERIWRERGACAVYASPMHNRGGFLPTESVIDSPRRDCWIYRHTLFVAWNGAVLACCHDLAGGVDYGNLARDDLAQLDARRAARLVYTFADAMCRRCDFFLA